MNKELYEKQFREKANQAGYSEEDIIKCLKYANPILEKNLPVIYNTSNLCAFVGYNKRYLKRASIYTNSFYREFSIKKKNGRFRTLKEPLPSLKEIQSWILKNILYEIPISRFAKAYIPKRNIIDNVKYHKNKKMVLGLDICDFFSMITRASVEMVFLDCGYSSNISNLLSKLCCCDEILPQGAVTSPCLSNIYMRDFDTIIADYCEEVEIRYTRYADDLTFSGDINTEELISFVSKALAVKGLKLNQEKVKMMFQNERQIVTGIVVNKKIQISITERKKIRQEVYYLNKNGLAEHLHRTNNQKSNYILHLLGKINYALHINPKDEQMQEYKIIVNKFV